MGSVRKVRYFVGDFETTVEKDTSIQTSTEVWASASVELNTEDVQIFHSIADQFNYFLSLKSNLIVYYHNLKFDGSFWLSYLFNIGYKQAYNEEAKQFLDNRKMCNKSFKTCISDMGQWYTVTIKAGGYIIELRDSLKLLPFPLKRIGESFKTKHQKLTMEYIGKRYVGCPISEEEKHYIANDVLVIKEALEIMFDEGHNKLTIGSCCLAEFKTKFDKEDYKNFFPDLTSIIIDEELYGSKNADEYIRKSYKGGWCYVVKGKENKVFNNGITLDVNSLYPSVMSSQSGSYYPIGKPVFWKGNYIPEQAFSLNKYYFVRIKTRFNLKPDKLPFIQIKGNILYSGNEMLRTNAYWDKNRGCYTESWIDYKGELHDTIATLTLTCTDFQLLKEHYYLTDFEILDGCWFYAEIGIFDEYINHYKKIKMESKGAIRELAKLFLNNLYGKLASSTISSFKVAYLKSDGSLGYNTIEEYNKEAGYIACGSAITSYARNFTIRTAQQNYYGSNNSGFIYADTDSIHCDLPLSSIKGVIIDNAEFCCWKPETNWDEAIFVRQKTYIEHIIAENLQSLNKEEYYYNVKCAGMPDRCKELFVKSITNYEIKEEDKLTEKERLFIEDRKTIEDFKKGLIVPSKLMPVNVKGGVLLVETCYEMR